MNSVLKLIRIRQWYKNVIIFLPLVFSFQFLISDSLIQTIFGFLVLCIVSSAIYILNDIKDVNADRNHPEKRNRPLARGDISIVNAKKIFLSLIIIGVVSGFFLNWQFGIVILILILNTTIYSVWSKNFVYVDVFAIGLNFILRAIAGIVLLSTEFSPWVIIGVFLVALFLGFLKRKNELMTMEEGYSNHRNVLKSYTIDSLNKILIVTAILVIIIYGMYVFVDNPTNDFRLVFTIPIFVFIVTRQLMLSKKKNNLKKFYEVINDVPTILGIILYTVFTLALFYFI